MKKVLVTGATGFLGKYVVEELVEHGYQVRAFGRNRTIGQSLANASVTFIQGDLTNQEDLTKACQEMDMVVHAGALSTVWGPWEDFYQTNVLGTKYVLEACHEANIERLVYVSSPSIYAAPRDQLGIKESDAPQENRLNITFEVNWHQKNYLKIILMCLVSYCDLEDFLGLETPVFCHVFLILVRRSVFL